MFSLFSLALDPTPIYLNISPQLIKACIKQERQAQSELYRLCYGVLMGVCLRYHTNKEDAVAAMNQGFLKILNKLESRGESVPFEAWIRRIMINTLIDEFRKNRRRKEMIHYTDWEEPVPARGEELDFNEADQRLDAEAVEVLIQALPPMSRQVFNLFAVDGYAHQEIADRLGISVGTSKWHVSNARKTLQEQLKALMKREENLSL